MPQAAPANEHHHGITLTGAIFPEQRAGSVLHRTNLFEVQILRELRCECRHISDQRHTLRVAVLFQFFIHLPVTNVHPLRRQHKGQHKHQCTHSLCDFLSCILSQRIQHSKKATAAKECFQRLQMIYIPQGFIRRDHCNHDERSQRRDRY